MLFQSGGLALVGIATFPTVLQAPASEKGALQMLFFNSKFYNKQPFEVLFAQYFYYPFA